MTFIRRYFAGFALLSSLILLLIIFLGMQIKAHQGRLGFKHLQGDPSVLKDITLKGIFQDQYHQQEFTNKKDLIKIEEFRVYNHYKDKLYSKTLFDRDVSEYYLKLGYSIPFGRANSKLLNRQIDNDLSGSVEYILSEYLTDEIELQLTITHRNKSGEGILFEPKVTFKSDEQEYQLEIFSRRFPYEEEVLYSLLHEDYYGDFFTKQITKIDNTLYFTVAPTVKGIQNTGIYSLEVGDKSFEQLTNEVIKDVVSFDFTHQQVKVLGLQEVNNKLIFILTINEELVLQMYEPETGDLLDEVFLPIGGTFDIVLREGFVQGDLLNICLGNFIERGSVLIDSILTVKVSNEIEVKNYLQIDQQFKEAFEHISFMDIAYIQDKVYAFARITLYDNDRDSILNLWPDNYYRMFVFEGNNLVYEGELVLDLNEDNISSRLKSRNYSQGIEHIYFNSKRIRSLDHIKIESAK